MTNMCITIVSALVGIASCAPLYAQPSLSQYEFNYSYHSGDVVNQTSQPSVLSSFVVAEPGAQWLRLRFDELTLSPATSESQGALLRIVSLEDGAEQYLDRLSAEQWGYTSAYFNGDAVLVELFAYPNSGSNEIRMSSSTAGSRSRNGPDLSTLICDGIDDRVLSSDLRIGRALPIICTSWIADDCEHCFITAGHCNQNSFTSINVVQFNVPLSDSSCDPSDINHPHPNDQYAVDKDSHQTTGSQGAGEDWGYFGVFPNSNTGLLPWEVASDWFVLDTTGLPTSAARVTGYGSVASTGLPCEWNLVQKTATGTFNALVNDVIEYRVDITGGNSGSPVFVDGTNRAVGIVNFGGCQNGPTATNPGTWVGDQGLQNAISSPLGVCAPPPGPAYSFPNGLPDIIDQGGESLGVTITQSGSLVPIPASGTITYNDGSGPVTTSLTYLGNDNYTATLPGGECFTDIEFWFNIGTVDGKNYRQPAGSNYNAAIADDFRVTADLDFEIDPGWTVSGTASAGQWIRATPGNYGRSDPPTDGDGSGMAFVTGSNPNEDLDGGPVSLTTSTFDLTEKLRSELLFYVWHETNDPGNDVLTVEISDDGGSNWVTLETISNTIGWEEYRFFIRDHVNITSSVVVRFTSVDASSSITESAIDGFRIGTFICIDGCIADTNNDGMLTPTDFNAWNSAWTNGEPKGDQNKDGLYSQTDFNAWINNYNMGCPQ